MPPSATYTELLSWASWNGARTVRFTTVTVGPFAAAGAADAALGAAMTAAATVLPANRRRGGRKRMSSTPDV